MSTPRKTIFKSTTTRSVGLSALVVGAIVWVIRTQLGLDVGEDLENAISVVLVGVVTPILSRYLKQWNVPGFSSLALFLAPAVLLGSLTGCATNVGTFEEYDPTTGQLLYAGKTKSKAGYGGSIEEAQSSAQWKNNVTPEGKSEWELSLAQQSAGLASPDTAATVATLVGQIVAQVMATQQVEMQLAAQGNPNLRMAVDLLGNPEVLNFLNNIASGLIVPVPGD